MSKELIAEINRLRESLRDIAEGSNDLYEASARELRRRAIDSLKTTPLSSQRAESMALMLTMQNAGRYLECLHAVVLKKGHMLPMAFVMEVKKDFASYASKMIEAGMPVKTDISFGEPDAQE